MIMAIIILSLVTISGVAICYSYQLFNHLTTIQKQLGDQAFYWLLRKENKNEQDKIRANQKEKSLLTDFRSFKLLNRSSNDNNHSGEGVNLFGKYYRPGFARKLSAVISKQIRRSMQSAQ